MARFIKDISATKGKAPGSLIFIPLTFFAGVYGMNFSYFPEIEFKYSYPLFWLVTLSISVGLIFFLQKKEMVLNLK